MISFLTVKTEAPSKSKTKSTQKKASTAATTSREYYSISSTALQILSLYRYGDVSIRKFMGLWRFSFENAMVVSRAGCI